MMQPKIKYIYRVIYPSKNQKNIMVVVDGIRQTKEKDDTIYLRSRYKTYMSKQTDKFQKTKCLFQVLYILKHPKKYFGFTGLHTSGSQKRSFFHKLTPLKYMETIHELIFIFNIYKIGIFLIRQKTIPFVFMMVLYMEL